MEEKVSLSEDIQTKVKQWLKDPFDSETQKEVKELLSANKDKLVDAFYKDLSFGTAGMRGIMGVGTNRLNIYTIRAATQGLSHYILKQKHKNPSVVIGHDNRHNSRLFAKEAAKVLAANHITVYLTQDLRPTPFVSFALREKKSIAGIMITASHNPPEYNGYKVYWSDGAQVVPPHDTGIIDEVKKIQDISQVKVSDENDKLIQLLTEEDDNAYIQALKPLQNHPHETENKGSKLSIVYSPLHGAGVTLMSKALSSWGFTNLQYVKEQMPSDGNFPFAKSPNPEEKGAMQLGMKMLQSTHADIFFATDPDSDRIGVSIMKGHAPFLLTGNHIATLCTYYLLKTYQKQKRLSKHHAIISTIVTTRILSKMCQDFHVKYSDTLTGFKYIGEKIKIFEETPDGLEFLFGAEESYGFLYGTHARDKDAIVTACLLSEIALMQKEEGKTLLDLLEEAYDTYGFHHEKQLSIKFEGGLKSLQKMQAMITRLREAPPKTFNHIKIIEVADYLKNERHNLKSHKKEKLSLPKSNVLSYKLEDGSQFIIRPSGTEPKIKIYAMTHSLEKDSFDSLHTKLDHFLDNMLSSIKDTYFSP